MAIHQRLLIEGHFQNEKKRDSKRRLISYEVVNTRFKPQLKSN